MLPEVVADLLAFEPVVDAALPVDVPVALAVNSLAADEPRLVTPEEDAAAEETVLGEEIENCWE